MRALIKVKHSIIHKMNFTDNTKFEAFFFSEIAYVYHMFYCDFKYFFVILSKRNVCLCPSSSFTMQMENGIASN